MRQALRLINEMQADGVIGSYAIGGSIGAMYYLEPFATKHIDVFLTLPVLRGSKIISLQAIYDYLLAKGCSAEDLYIRMGSWLVQFLNPTNNLEHEAIQHAARVTIDGVETSVMRPEHLVAICLQTGRAKDKLRIIMFLEQKAVDPRELRLLLERHGLSREWQRFERTYLSARTPPPRDSNPRNLKVRRRKELRELASEQKVRVIEELRDLGVAMRKARVSADS